MKLKSHRRVISHGLVVLLLSVTIPAYTQQSDNRFNDYWGSQYSSQEGISASPRLALQVDGPEASNPNGTNTILRWNSISVDASGLDHTPVAPGENRVFGEQVGPCRSSRAIAIVHIAMFEAINSGRLRFRHMLTPARENASCPARVTVGTPIHQASRLVVCPLYGIVSRQRSIR